MAKAAVITDRFLMDFSIWFGPDGNVLNVGIYIQAWFCCTSPTWSQLPSLLSLSPSSPFSSYTVLKGLLQSMGSPCHACA